MHLSPVSGYLPFKGIAALL